MRKDGRKSGARGGSSGSSGNSSIGGALRAGIFRKIVIAIMLTAWGFVFASLIGFDRADPPSHVVWPHNNPVANWCGPVGAFTVNVAQRLSGFSNADIEATAKN